MKSTIWLLDPRPDLPAIVHSSSTPSSFPRPRLAGHDGVAHPGLPCARALRRKEPARRFRARRCGAPSALRPHFSAAVNYAQEKQKIDTRFRPQRASSEARAQRVHRRRHGESASSAGWPLQRACARCSSSASPMRSARAECRCTAQRHLPVGAGRDLRVLRRQARPCWWSRRGSPSIIEQAVIALLRRDPTVNTTIVGKGVLPMAGEYTAEVMLRRPRGFSRRGAEGSPARHGRRGTCRVALEATARTARRDRADAAAGVLRRLPGAAGVFRDQLIERDTGDPRHRRHRLPRLLYLAAVQHGRHDPRLWPGLASAPRRFRVRAARHHHHGRRRLLAQRPHAGIASAVFNKHDGIL